ncbi:MAG: hypothetical protein VX427_13390 [Acidobacteriota bacterium]|nr:hypothetical protein [Acidobacteriota bacterium]
MRFAITPSDTAPFDFDSSASGEVCFTDASGCKNVAGSPDVDERLLRN